MVSIPLVSYPGIPGSRLPLAVPPEHRTRIDASISRVVSPADVERLPRGAAADAAETPIAEPVPEEPSHSASPDVLESPVLRGVIEDLLRGTRFAFAADTCALLWPDVRSGAMVPRIVVGKDLPSSLSIASLNPRPHAGAIQIDLGDSARATTGCLCPIGDAGALLATWPQERQLDVAMTGTLELAAMLVAAAVDQSSAGTLEAAAWRHLESTLNASVEGVVARDASGRVIHMNAAAREILGVDPATPTALLNEMDVISSLDLRDQLGRPLNLGMLPAARLRTGTPASDLLVSARPRDDGQRQWMLLQAVAVPDARGDAAVVITFLRDVAMIQRRDEGHWLRGRMAEHLHHRPIDLRAIEHDIAAFLDGDCSIVLNSQAASRPHLAAARPLSRRTRGWHVPDEADDATSELTLACGHLHHDPTAFMASGIDAIQSPPHVVDIPIVGEGMTHGRMTCKRASTGHCFDREELELMTELAEKIGLALSVSSLRESLDAGERLLVEIGQRLQDAEEAERRRVALSIHDGLAQVAASVCQQLEILAHRLAPSCEADSVELDRARTLARRTVQEARMLIAGLRPVTLDQHGLGRAVLEEVEALRAEGWSIRLLDGLSAARFDGDVELDAFRVIQESLSNARKHAGRVEIEVLLEQRDATLHFEVRDHGAGFDPREAERRSSSGSHVGLGGMRERMAHMGGTVSVESELGKGTCVRGDVPV